MRIIFVALSNNEKFPIYGKYYCLYSVVPTITCAVPRSTKGTQDYSEYTNEGHHILHQYCNKDPNISTCSSAVQSDEGTEQERKRERTVIKLSNKKIINIIVYCNHIGKTPTIG